MNRDEREKLIERVRRSDNPYKALFGTDARTANATRQRLLDRGTLLPPREILPEPADRMRLTQKVAQRTLQIMKHLDPELYADIYEAEMKLAVAQLGTGAKSGLWNRYRRKLIPGRDSVAAEEGGAHAASD